MDQSNHAVLSEYENYIFNSIVYKCELKKWYSIKPNRPDYSQFIATIKKRIDLYGDVEFSSDYSQFRYIRTFDESMKIFDKNQTTCTSNIK